MTEEQNKHDRGEIKAGQQILCGREQIARYMGTSKRTVSRLLESGRIPCRRLSHKLIMCRVQDIDRVLAPS